MGTQLASSRRSAQSQNRMARMLRLLGACAVLILAGCHSSNAIAGGSTTSIEKHPYQVAIDRVTIDDDDDDYIVNYNMICAGALLTSRTVVTAASCFSASGEVGVDSLRVRVGSQFREEGGEAYNVTGYVQHPDYGSWFFDYDVLVLFLDDDVPFRAEVHSVPLVDPAKAMTAGDVLIMTGYGDLHADEVLPDGEVRELQVATLPFINQDLCEEVHYFFPGDNRACAGGAKSGMCGSRDIGAPLVNWRGELVGVALQQLRTCAVAGEPTVFTNFADDAINKWIVSWGGAGA